MKNLGAGQRSLKAAFAMGALISGLMVAQPTYSAQSDLDRIQSYVGVWRGSGKLLDAEGGSETLRCKLTIAKSSASKVTLNGNCTGSGLGRSSLTGTLSYMSESRRYEAIISAPLDSTVVGRKRGSNINFHFSQSIEDERVDRAVANFLLKPDAMVLDFIIDFTDGGRWTTSIPLAQR